MQILKNWVYLLGNASALSLRIPVIPGFNDDTDHMVRLRQFIISTMTSALKNINLLPFHTIGSSKYKRFSLPYMMEGVDPPSGMQMKELKNFFLATGLNVKIGG